MGFAAFLNRLFRRPPRYDYKAEVKRLAAYYEAHPEEREAILAKRSWKPTILIDSPAAAPTSRSKLGGLPELPEGWEIPHSPEGNPMALLLQLDCAALPPGYGLPDCGMLYFFFDADSTQWNWGLETEDCAYWSVLYTELPPRQPEIGSPAPAFREVPVSFRLSRSWYTEEDETGIETDENPGGHRLLGYPFELQSGQAMAAACSELTGAPSDTEWELLLQLDTDDDANGPGWMWGDMGMLFFWIRRDDLAARRFDRVRMILECY